MANITFRINNGKKIIDQNALQTIYLRYRLGREVDFCASIGFKVLLNDWDIEKQVVKNRSQILNRHEINNLINSFKSYFNEFENKNREKGLKPNYKEVKNHYDKFFKISEPVKQNTLFTFIDEFIEDAKTKPNVHTRKLVSKGTNKGYELTKVFLTRFNDEVYKIDFDSITLEWYYDFIEWCNKQNLSLNYIGKHVKTLKTFMNTAVDLGLTNNLQFKSNKFIVQKEESDNIYLTIDELLSMWKLNLSKEPRKEIARDLFLIGAFTGLRVSDYNKLTEKNIKTETDPKTGKAVKMLKVKTEKTGKIVAIPLHPIVNAILEKNNGLPPKQIPDQHINDLIKLVAESSEIDSIEYVEQTRGGKKVSIKKYKFDLVKTHTARRSFCTNAYLSGMSAIDIMSISGHTTESSFMKYIKVTPEQVAIKMSEHPFFNSEDFLRKVI